METKINAKVRRLKHLELTAGKECTIIDWDEKIEKYEVDFHDGFFGWYKVDELWYKNLTTGKWELYNE